MPAHRTDTPKLPPWTTLPPFGTGLDRLQGDDFCVGVGRLRALRLFERGDDFFQALLLMKRDFVEDTKSRYRDEDGTGDLAEVADLGGRQPPVLPLLWKIT